MHLPHNLSKNTLAQRNRYSESPLRDTGIVEGITVEP